MWYVNNKRISKNGSGAVLCCPNLRVGYAHVIKGHPEVRAAPRLKMEVFSIVVMLNEIKYQRSQRCYGTTKEK